MKLTTSIQMRECDRRTIAGENLEKPTDGLILMERAGWGIFAALRRSFRHLGQRPVMIFCGRGNNGGDGLVVARLLQERAQSPVVMLLGRAGDLSPDARVQHERYRQIGGRIHYLPDEASLLERVAAELRTAGRYAPLLVDALLGTGSTGAPRGLIGACVRLMERLRIEHHAEVLAVDLPTGVNADTGAVPGVATRADLTATMAFAKVGFFFHPGRQHLGKLVVVDIGIPHSVADDVGLPLALMTAAEARELLPQRAPDAHKGRVGRILIIGGSPGLTGAPALAGMAALRSGAGLITAAVPSGLNLALEAKLTEVMTLPCPQTAAGGLDRPAEEAILARAETTDVWVLGPGLGREEPALALARRLFGRLPGPIVVDADALFALGKGDWRRPTDSPPPILTPHPGEMARLLGTAEKPLSAPPYEVAQGYARERGCILVLKGAPTVIASPDGQVWVNPTGNAGLATGGSGDALSGIIAALLGQGLAPAEAARVGVFLHGEAADRACSSAGLAGLAPTDLIAALPEAWRHIEA
jgi:NAD(P)H-hydrate epimerase